MHRAKHRAGAADSSAVLATTLVERFAVVSDTRCESVDTLGGLTALSARADTAHPLFGNAGGPAPMLTVPEHEDAPAGVAPLFDEDGDAEDRARDGDDAAPVRSGDRSPFFGAARHAARPSGRGTSLSGLRLLTPPAGMPAARPRSGGTALSVTVLGVAAAVTAVAVPPPTAVETTGSLAPVQGVAPVAPALKVPAPAAPAPAPAALSDEPTLQVDDLVTRVTGEMQKVDRPYTTVAQTGNLSSPAVMRRAAMTNALAKLGRPYRWGAMGPNAFDCSGLVKWSFGNAGLSLPRTSRAMATVGVRVARADLQPGDLVFFYSPISHVGIYIGNGKIVHASQSGQPVKISDMGYMRFTTARRIV